MFPLSPLRPEPAAGGLLLNQSLISNLITLISNFSPSIGMEDQSTILLLDWFNWLIASFFILLEWFWIVFADAQSLAEAAVGLVFCIPDNLENAIIQLTSHVAYFSSWPESFHLSMSFHLFCSSCTSCVFCRHAFVCLSPFQDLTMKLSLIQSVGLIAKAISECVKKQGYVFSRKQELINVMLVSSQSFQFVKTSHEWSNNNNGVLISLAAVMSSLVRILSRQSQLIHWRLQYAILWWPPVPT